MSVIRQLSEAVQKNAKAREELMAAIKKRELEKAKKLQREWGVTGVSV